MTSETVEPRDVPLGDVCLSEVGGDGAGPAADVEDGHGGFEVGEEMSGGVLSCTPAMRAKDRFMVTVNVCVGRFLRHGAWVILAVVKIMLGVG